MAWANGSDHIRQSIQLILLTEPGERLMLPQFGAGLQQFLFEPNTPATHRLMQDRISRALKRREPRIRVESIDIQADADNARAAHITITYALVATGEQDRVNLTVTLAG